MPGKMAMETSKPFHVYRRLDALGLVRVMIRKISAFMRSMGYWFSSQHASVSVTVDG